MIGGPKIRQSSALSTLHWLFSATPPLIFGGISPFSSVLLKADLYVLCPLGFLVLWLPVEFHRQEDQQKIWGLEDGEIGGTYSPYTFSVSCRGGWILPRPLSTAPAHPGTNIIPSFSPSTLSSLPHSLWCPHRPGGVNCFPKLPVSGYLTIPYWFLLLLVPYWINLKPFECSLSYLPKLTDLASQPGKLHPLFSLRYACSPLGQSSHEDFFNTLLCELVEFWICTVVKLSLCELFPPL